MNEEDDIEEDSIDDYFRWLQAEGRWILEVGIVEWPSPDQPEIVWKPFRTWKNKPTADRLVTARAAAALRYFRTCTHCQELCNLGHMHDRTTCQGCAEGLLGVVH